MFIPSNNSVGAKSNSKQPAAKYCTLYIRNEGLPSMHFEVRVTMATVLVDQIKTINLAQVARFLAKYEIFQKDLQEALDIFETHGHNVIGFGLFGTPVTSSFEGSIH